MSPEQFKLLDRLFNQALDLEPGTRDAFIAEHTTNDAQLATALRRLLATDAQTNSGIPAQEQLGRAVHAVLSTGEEESPGTGCEA